MRRWTRPGAIKRGSSASMLLMVSYPGRRLQEGALPVPFLPILFQMIPHRGGNRDARSLRCRPRRPVQCGFRALPDQPLRAPRPSKCHRPKQRGPGGRKPQEVGHALRMFGDGPLVPFPDLERRWHIGIALKIDRKRQRVHHGAAGALSDVRRQRVRGVADDRHPSRRPAPQLDQIEAIVATLLAEAVDQRLEMGKPCLPRILPHRRGLGDLVAIRSEEHTSELQSPYDLGCRLLLEKKKAIQRLRYLINHYCLLCRWWIRAIFL